MGVGGGIIIIPLLILLFGYDQLKAQGTSLAILLPPIGLLGFLQYWRNPDVQINMVAALIIALTFMAGAHFGGKWANMLDAETMRRYFAVFLAFVAVWLFFKP